MHILIKITDLLYTLVTLIENQHNKEKQILTCPPSLSSHPAQMIPALAESRCS